VLGELDSKERPSSIERRRPWCLYSAYPAGGLGQEDDEPEEKSSSPLTSPATDDR
jgi:hypothetical protein